MGIHPTIEAATLSMWDTMIVMIMALVVFGPRRLPKIGRQIGKLMYEFRKASNDFRFQMEEELRNAEEADRRQREDAERQRALASPAQVPAQIEAPTPTAEETTASTSESPQEYAATAEHDGRASYDEAAYEHYQSGAPADEPEPEPERLRVQPPATGAPVPAERPTSRVTAPAAASLDPAQGNKPPAEAEPPVFLPSGDEAAHSQPGGLSTEIPTREIPASEAGAETEPAAHHG